MARIKLVYIGGGSTRAPGTVASIIERGAAFAGSEIALLDLDAEHLAIVQQLATAMARDRGHDLTFTTWTDRRAALEGCDAVLSSYRPGGFAARCLDEAIPLKHGVIGQETQGPGGFFMALRSIHVMRGIIEDMETVCPRARLFNYTNPINIVSEAVTHHSAIPTVSLCEGPLTFPNDVLRPAGLDPKRLDSLLVGLNHGCWSARHLYDGADVMPLLAEAYARLRGDADETPPELQLLELAVTMESIPASYMRYYYYREQVLAALAAKPTTRAQDILAEVPDYWRHYREQARSDSPTLDPQRSRGGINELELAIDVIDAVVNDRPSVWPVNVPNRGALTDFPDDLVVEVQGLCDRHGVTPLAHGHLPPPVRGLMKALGEYQALAAEAAWCGTRADAIRALSANPLVPTLAKAERIYDELAQAQRAYLPDRLLR